MGIKKEWTEGAVGLQGIPAGIQSKETLYDMARHG